MKTQGITVNELTKSGREWVKQFGYGNYLYNKMIKDKGEDATVTFIERVLAGDMPGTKHRKMADPTKTRMI